MCTPGENGADSVSNCAWSALPTRPCARRVARPGGPSAGTTRSSLPSTPGRCWCGSNRRTGPTAPYSTWPGSVPAVARSQHSKRSPEPGHPRGPQAARGARYPSPAPLARRGRDLPNQPGRQSMNDRVRIDIANGVADVRMVRADKLNALDDPMFDALVEAGRAVAANPEVRCVVLSGEGRAFCAGIDLGRLAHRADGKPADPPLERLAERTHGVANKPQYSAWVWHELPVPVIAAVHGVAFGGGFQIMLGADMRYIHPETKLSIMEVRWGLVPDMAGTVLMRGL